MLILWLASFALLASEIIWFFSLWTTGSESIPTVDPYYDDFTPAADPYGYDDDGYDPYDSYNSYAAALKKAALVTKYPRALGLSGRSLVRLKIRDDRYGDGGFDDIFEDGGSSGSSSGSGSGSSGELEDAIVQSLVAPICVIAAAALGGIEL